MSELSFTSPSFGRRLKGMLGVDFYRLFHTPMYFIFLGIAAVIPAMILGTAGMENPQTGEVTARLYHNVWHIIAAEKPVYVVSDIAQYANMNMVFIFGGIMVSVFIGHDYRSGYVKQLFTTHPRKIDYMLSKSITCAFAMACMCLTYLVGAVLAGALTGVSFAVDPVGLLSALLGKIVLSLGWASLYTFLNIIFRRYFGISIVSSFFFGTGILIIGVAAVVGNSAVLNLLLYGASVYACLSGSLLTVAVCAGVSLLWMLVYNLLGTWILSKCDVY